MKANVIIIIVSGLLVVATIYGFVVDEISLRLFLMLLLSSLLLIYSMLHGLIKGR